MADVAEFIQCDARNYTPGRRGCGVSNVVVADDAVVECSAGAVAVFVIR